MQPDRKRARESAARGEDEDEQMGEATAPPNEEDESNSPRVQPGNVTATTRTVTSEGAPAKRGTSNVVRRKTPNSETHMTVKTMR